MTDRDSLDPDDLEGLPQDAFTARLKRAARDVDRRAPQDLALRVLDAAESDIEELVAPGGSWSEPWWETVRRSPWMRLAAASLALHLFGVPLLAYVLWWPKDEEPQLNLSFLPPQENVFEQDVDDAPAPLPELSPEELERWERGANRRRLDELRLAELTSPPSVGVHTPVEAWVAARLGGDAPSLGSLPSGDTKELALAWLAQCEWQLDRHARGLAEADVTVAEIDRWRDRLEDICAEAGQEPWVAGCRLLFERIERRAERYAGLSAEGDPPHDELWDPRGWLRAVGPALSATQAAREPWLTWLRWARE